MDNLIPIFAALVGIFIMFALFKSISSADVKVPPVPVTAQNTRKSRTRKVASKRPDDELDAELESLIAYDISKSQNQTGLSVDTKRIQPEVLEQDKGRKQAKAPFKHAAAAGANYRKSPDEEDLSFQTVRYTARQNKKKSKTVKPEDDINEKMMNFFKYNKFQKSKDSNVDEAKPQAEVGGHVLTYGTLGTARSWNEPH